MTATSEEVDADTTAPEDTLPTVVAAAAAIRNKTLSPVELTETVLDRIKRIDPLIESYVDVYPEGALAQARVAEEAVSRGEQLGPLHGVPVALKDLYDVAGFPTLAGSAVREGHVARIDSEVTTRLLAAGAIIVGKVVTHEFAFGVVSAPTRNPWDLSTIPGGSSGGSAAAVSARLCLAAMGSDTGGSIRIPAGLTGLTDDDRFIGIRCPKCQWQPESSSRWRCLHCDCSWNTFDTRGMRNGLNPFTLARNPCTWGVEPNGTT